MTQDEMQVLGGQVVITLNAKYVHVKQSRGARNLPELSEITRAVDHQLRRERRARVLFDSREAESSPEEVQEGFWKWMGSAGFDRIATLVTSRHIAVSVRMKGVSLGINIRAFDSLAMAERWLKE